MAQEVLKLGMYIGLGGAVTFKNAKKPVAVAAATDISRILLETDCPYMAPVPLRGTRCSSDMIAYSAQTIANIKISMYSHLSIPQPRTLNGCLR